MEGLILIAAFGAVVGFFIGKAKGDEKAGALLGLLLGPLGWLVGLFFIKDRSRKCPDCLGSVPDAATKCRHCGAALSVVRPSPATSLGQRASAPDYRPFWRVVFYFAIALVAISAMFAVALLAA